MTHHRGVKRILPFLHQRWFLLLLAGGVALAVLAPHVLWPVVSRLAPRVVIAVALFLMAWGLESRRLLAALRRPLPALWAAIVSYGLLPALAWLCGFLLADADLRLGLIIIAAAPCTLASAVLWTRLAGGCEATALLTVFLTTAASWLATTAWLALAADTAIGFDPADGMLSLFLTLMVPVALGQLARASGPLARAAIRYKSFAGVVSQLFVLSIILKAAVEASARLRAEAATPDGVALLLAAVLCLGVHTAAFTGAFWGGRTLGVNRPECIAAAFAGSQKSLPVALFLFDRYFRAAHPLAAVPLVLYHIEQLIVDTFFAEAIRKRAPHGPDTVL